MPSKRNVTIMRESVLVGDASWALRSARENGMLLGNELEREMKGMILLIMMKFEDKIINILLTTRKRLDTEKLIRIIIRKYMYIEI